MKKISSIILAASLLAFMAVFQSCEEETNPAPEINFLNGISSVDLEPGDSTYSIAGSITAEAGLDEVKLFQVTDVGETQLGSAITSFKSGAITTSDDVTYNFQFGINDITQDVVIKIQATDKDNQTASKNFTINHGGEVAGPINTWNETLGSYDSNTGSSFATSNGEVYTWADATANSELIDFLYFYGATNEATLAAPDNSDAESVFTGLDGWDTQNATRFKETTLAASDFDDVDDDAVIVAEAEGANLTKVNQLAQGDIIAFETEDGKKGLVKIGSIDTGAAGTMDISVKVQQ